MTVGADDLHRLPGAGDRGADLHNARIGGAGKGVDLLKKRDLGFERNADKRVAVAIERAVAGGDRRLGRGAGIAAGDGLHTVGGTAQRGLAEVAGMGIAMRLAGNGAKAETARLVVSGAFQPAIIDHQHFGMTHFQKQFAIIGIDKRLADNGLCLVAVQRARAKENVVGGVKMVHVGSFAP